MPNFDSNDSTRSQFCTCHDSWAVMTCAKLWPAPIIVFEENPTWILTRFGFWAHKPFVSWVPDIFPDFPKKTSECSVLEPQFPGVGYREEQIDAESLLTSPRPWPFKVKAQRRSLAQGTTWRHQSWEITLGKVAFPWWRSRSLLGKVASQGWRSNSREAQGGFWLIQTEMGRQRCGRMQHKGN